MNKVKLIIVIGIVGLISQSTRVFACACCTNGNELSEYQEELAGYKFDEIRNVRLSGTFGVYVYGERGSDINFKPSKVEGIIQNDALILSLSLDGKKLGDVRFKFNGPATWLIRDKKFLEPLPSNDEYYSQTIYKEMKVNGEFEDLKNVASKLGFSINKKGTLFLHGQGNSCFNASDLFQWNLVFSVTDGKASEGGRAHGQVEVLTEKEKARTLNSEGMEAYRKKDYDSAVSLFTESIQIDANYLLPHTNLACIYALQGFNKGAIEMLKKAIFINPKSTINKMKTDKDFDSLRDSPEFQALLSGGTTNQ